VVTGMHRERIDRAAVVGISISKASERRSGRTDLVEDVVYIVSRDLSCPSPGDVVQYFRLKMDSKLIFEAYVGSLCAKCLSLSLLVRTVNLWPWVRRGLHPSRAEDVGCR